MIERLFGDVPGWREACAEGAAEHERLEREYELAEPWFAELRAELLGAFRTEEIARRWFFEQRTPAFGGKTPAEMVLAGELERVTGLLVNVNNGMFS
jgi:hypothetical protein